VKLPSPIEVVVLVVCIITNENLYSRRVDNPAQVTIEQIDRLEAFRPLNIDQMAVVLTISSNSSSFGIHLPRPRSDCPKLPASVNLRSDAGQTAVSIAWLKSA